MAVKKGAEILIDALKSEGVEVIFGYPGGAVLPLFDALYDADIRFVLVRHEQAAAHAADGYARATGKVGVCCATSGPGSTNLVTGIATANFDSIPVVAITGQVKTHLIGNDAFQEADTTGITRPITKHNYLVRRVEDLGRVVKEAFHIAGTGRPGPVLIDIPVDVTMSECEECIPEEVSLPGYKPTYRGNIRQVEKAAAVINASERPVIYAGGGVIISGAHAELLELVEKANIPVTTTLLGLGAVPSDHPLNLGMLGMHGTVYANKTIQASDLIVAVGARFDDRVTGKIEAFAPHAKIVHIDIDPASISKNVKVDVPLVGDAKLILQELNERVVFKERKSWMDTVRGWKEKYPMRYERKEGEIVPQFVIEKLCELTDDDTIVATEVGQNQMWVAQWYKFKKPRTLLTSGGLGTMGYGFPAAIGAQVGCPGRTVVDVAGDGSIQMNIQELATVVQHNIPVKIVILNNGYLGMVRQWQELFYNRRYSHTAISSPDFVKLAEAYGLKGMLIEDPAEVEDAISEALKIDGPVVMDFRVAPEENVFPMVPAGEAIDRMIGGMA